MVYLTELNLMKHITVLVSAFTVGIQVAFSLAENLGTHFYHQQDKALEMYRPV